MNNLPEIRDIHFPDGVSMFPLAYGWWVIAAAIILFFIFIKVMLWIFRTSKKHYALKQLKNIETKNPINAAVQVSELLRRICNVKYKQASALYGQEWIDFLNQHAQQQKLMSKEADLLLYAPFIKKEQQKYSSQDAEELKEFCKKWIGANL